MRSHRGCPRRWRSWRVRKVRYILGPRYRLQQSANDRPAGILPARSCRSRQKLGQSHQVVGSGSEGEGPADAVNAPELCLALPGDGLDPAKRFLNALSDAHADPISSMTGGPSVDARSSPGEILRDVRRYLHRAQLIDEVRSVIAL